MRFAKYKGPEIGRIEAHNERTKETYASNPDIDISRSKQNFHLITPQRKYRAEAEKQIAEAQCRVRSDSVRVVEKMKTQLKKYSGVYKQLKAENAELEKKLDANKESVQRRLELTQKLTELEALRSTVNTLQQVLHTIPPEIIETYAIENSVRKETHTIE